MKLPKRTIDELIVRLQREKTIRELYVEGDFDRDLYRWALSRMGIKDVKVYPISTLDVPADLLRSLGMSSGERQRVVATAKQVQADPSLYSQVMFIIDSDMDHLLLRTDYAPPLFGTAGTSAELILWKKEIIQKFLSMGLGCESADRIASSLMEFVEPIVESICLLRAAKEDLGVNWKLIDIEKAFDRDTPFSFSVYCQKIGDKNGVRREIEEQLPACIRKIHVRARCLDSTKKIHGHDLFAAFSRKLHLDGLSQKIPKEFEALTRLVMASMEWSFVQNDPTIIMIKSQFSPPEVVAGLE